MRRLALLLLLTAITAPSIQAQTGRRILTFSGSTLHSVDPISGKSLATLNFTLAGSPVSATAAATDPTTGTLYAVITYSGLQHLVSVDPDTGAATDVTALAVPEPVVSIAFTATGALFAVTQVWGDYFFPSSSLYQIDKATGESTFVLDLWYDAMDNPYYTFALAFNPADGMLYSFASYYDYYDFPDTYAISRQRIDPASPGSSTWLTPIYYEWWSGISGVTYFGGGSFLLSYNVGELRAVKDDSAQFLTDVEAPVDALAIVGRAACGDTVKLYGAARPPTSTFEILYSLDAATGASQLVGPIGFDAVNGIDFAKDGVLYGIGYGLSGLADLFTIDPCTGEGTAIGSTDSNGFYDISIRPTDGALFTTYLGDSMYSSSVLAAVDLATGLASDVGSATGNKGFANALSFNLAGDTLYQAVTNGNGTQLYAVDTVSGVSTSLKPLTISGSGTLSAMDVDPATGSIFGVLTDSLGSASLATVDPNSGNVAVVASTQERLHVLAFRSGTTPSTFPLNVFRTGNGLGSVTSGGGEIDCGATCSTSVAAGATVTLQASPVTGYVFAGWTGACLGTGTCTITMNAPRSVTATFRKFIFTVYVGGPGAVTVDPPGDICDVSSCEAGLTEDYVGGTSVTLTPSPYVNYRFAYWNGGVCASAAAACTFTINADTTVIAYFQPYTTHVHIAGNGSVAASPGVTCGVADCYPQYVGGTVVNFTAIPALNSVFLGWSSDCAIAGTNSVCQVTIAQTTTVTATFGPVPAGQTTVNVQKRGVGSVTDGNHVIDCGLVCSTALPTGSSIALTASPNTGYVFTGWIGDCSGIGTCNLTLTTARSVTAVFAQIPTPPLNMTAPRYLATATLLGNGKVLLVGGFNNVDIDGLDSAELFDPATDHFVPTASMSVRRFGHTATLLPNGKVLVAGGWDRTTLYDTAELYDPASGSFSPSGAMTKPRDGHTATLLTNGKVLVAGGFSTEGTLASAELYDPTTGTFSPVGNMNYARRTHTATLLASGKVLITGGSDDCPTFTTAELFDPATNTFSLTGSMTHPRGSHAAVALQDGRVLIAGGEPYVCNDPPEALPWTDAEIFDPATNSFGAIIGMTDQHRFAYAALLPDGRATIVGGESNVIDVFSPATNAFNDETTLNFSRGTPTVTVLPDRRLLVAGGSEYVIAEVFYLFSSPALSVSKSGSGTGLVTSSPAGISCGVTCIATFTPGTSVTLTAIPSVGSQFIGWGSPCSGAPTCTITTTGDATNLVATFNLLPDTVAPTVSITSHHAADTVSGAAVTIFASANDNIGVAAVQFQLDGVNLGVEDTSPPYSAVWNTTTSTNGNHTLTAVARDAAGNIGTSTSVAVSVSNPTEFNFSVPAGSSAALTTNAGVPAVFKLNIAPTSGFTGNVSFTCTNVPTASTCTVSPNPAPQSGIASTAITVTITTTARSAISPALSAHTRPLRPYLGILALTFAAPLIVSIAGRDERRRRFVLMIAVFALLAITIACGGGSTSPTVTNPPPATGTPAGAYTVTVSGTAGVVTHSFDLRLTVN